MSDLWTAAAAKATQSSLCWSYQELGDGGGGGWAGGDEGQQNGLSQGTGNWAGVQRKGHLRETPTGTSGRTWWLMVQRTGRSQG